MKETNKTKAALVTGASSGIGKEITKIFLKKGIPVIGIGRHFSDDQNHPLFHGIIFDLKKTSQIPELIGQIRKDFEIQYLVNNAGVGYFGLHEELNPAKIHEMISVNLEAPLILSQLLLRDLKKNKGTILTISSITAQKNSPHGCAYGATKAALTSFSKSLFEESRKYGVKTICIHPDMTQSNFYRNADFKEGSSPDSYLLASEIAETISWILSARDGMVISELTIQPQKHQLGKKL